MQSDLIRIFSDQNESMLDLMMSRFVWLGRIDGRWLRTEECTRRPYFDSGKILQLKKPVINNFSTFFLNYFKNISRWWAETCSKPLLVLPAPYFSGSNDKWLRWLGPQFWNQKWCLSQSGQRWYLRWRTVCDQDQELETVSQSEVSTVTFCLCL